MKDFNIQSIKDCDRVNAQIKACGTGIRSGHTPVSQEFADEMLGAVPPEYMGTTMCFEYFQVGEAHTYGKDMRHKSPTYGEFVPFYETYTIVRDTMRTPEGKKSEYASAYEENQWYFIGLKPSMATT